MWLPAPDEALIVAVLRISLRIPGSRSLKDRRRVVASVRDRAQARHHVAFAEVGHLEAHDRAVVAAVVVGNDARQLRARLDALRADVESTADAILLDAAVEIIPVKGDSSLL
jgi:uncharacterized protein YlxP (DUF503 family)